MLDILPKLLTEIRDDADVASITTRIRGGEPGSPVIHPTTKAVIDLGDRRGPGEYVPFVVLVQLTSPREKGIPVQRARIAARCYGRTYQEAASLYAAVSDAVHNIGPRVHANGLGIYQTFDDTGGTEEKDPDTGQPLYTFVIEAIGTTQVVPA